MYATRSEIVRDWKHGIIHLVVSLVLAAVIYCISALSWLAILPTIYAVIVGIYLFLTVLSFDRRAWKNNT